MKKKFLLYLYIFITLFSYSQNTKDELKLYSKAAIVIDNNSEKIIFEKNADIIIHPASMTKLVTIYTALKILKQKNIPLDTIITVKNDADFRNAPPQSSLMFLQVGQKVSIKELIMGLAIPSGNDAAVAIALYCRGSIKTFVEDMNKNMRELKLKNSIFFDTSGYSSKNTTTVREFSYFCKTLIKEFPEILEITSLTEFTYPKERNLGKTTAIYGAIRQYNHNELIGRVKTVDGLKTGFIEESGNNVAITAKKDDTRIIAVLSGIYDQNKIQRSKKRLSDGKKIVSYIFENYETVEIPAPKIAHIKIKNGEIKYINSTKNRSTKRLILKENKNKILRSYKLKEKIEAPIKEDTIIGYWNYTLKDGTSKEFPLYPDIEVKKGNFLQRILH